MVDRETTSFSAEEGLSESPGLLLFLIVPKAAQPSAVEKNYQQTAGSQFIMINIAIKSTLDHCTMHHSIRLDVIKLVLALLLGVLFILGAHAQCGDVVRSEEGGTEAWPVRV